MDAAVKAIAEPRRRQILELVREGELSAGEIAAHFDVTRPAISQHLGVLKEAGLVSERRNGTRRLYLARPDGLRDLQAFLNGFWDERLEALRRESERKEAVHVDGVTAGISVEREIAIAASPEIVWELLTKEDEAIAWMGQSATFDLRPGGIYRVDVIPGNVARGEFVEIDPPHRLVFTWGWEEGASPVGPGSSTVEFELIPDGDGTLLRFRHFNLPSAEAAESHSHGWDHYLARLATLASGSDPGRDRWLERPMS